MDKDWDEMELGCICDVCGMEISFTIIDRKLTSKLPPEDIDMAFDRIMIEARDKGWLLKDKACFCPVHAINGSGSGGA